MEVTMSMTAQECDRQLSTEEQVLSALRGGGPQTIEMLASLPGLSWPQVFMAVDRLSRSGAVSLRPTGRGEDQVAVNRTAAWWIAPALPGLQRRPKPRRTTSSPCPPAT